MKYSKIKKIIDRSQQISSEINLLYSIIGKYNIKIVDNVLYDEINILKSELEANENKIQREIKRLGKNNV